MDADPVTMRPRRHARAGRHAHARQGRVAAAGGRRAAAGRHHRPGATSSGAVARRPTPAEATSGSGHAAGLGRGRPRRHRATTSGLVAALVAPGRRVRGGEGRRLRPRRGAGGPGRPRRGRRVAGAWPWSRRGRRCATPGIDAPILLLSEPPAATHGRRRRARPRRPTVYTAAGVDAAGQGRGRPRRVAPAAVHLKVDTGMHRVGAAPPTRSRLADADRRSRPSSCSTAVWTHFAVADEPDDPYTAEQLARFDAVARRSWPRAASGRRCVHAANSAGGHRPPRRPATTSCAAASPSTASRPAPALAGAVDAAAGAAPRGRGVAREGGRRRRGASPTACATGSTADTVVATVPVGYADGVPRRLGAVGGEVLIGGRRRPIAGVVTMDQLMVDCGDDGPSRWATRSCSSARQGDERDHAPTSGPSGSAPSPTRSCAASAPASPAATDDSA